MLVLDYFRELYRASVEGWNRFWFTPADVATLAVIRILAGAMLLYTHLVWTIELEAFFGPEGWLNPRAVAQRYTEPVPAADGEVQLRVNRLHWSHLWLLKTPEALWAAHMAALVVFAMLMIGLQTRIVSVLAFLLAVSYAHRAPLAQFGLDQINCMLAMYLMVGPAGAAYSVDRLIARCRGRAELPLARPSTSANIAIRLIQLHMCVIYFFAGLGKLQGSTWWRGDALWGAFANLEYQTWDMTWLAAYPLVVALLTHITTFWELSFCALVWPRLTRPLVLAVAVPLHLGIALCMGMITFGLIMLVGCSSFIPPELMRRVLEGRRLPHELAAASAAGQGGREPRAARTARSTMLRSHV